MQQTKSTDSGLTYPLCEYNLTGLAHNRCPECGQEFDPDTLRRWLSDEPTPAVPWDGERGIVGFVKTWLMPLSGLGTIALRSLIAVAAAIFVSII